MRAECEPMQVRCAPDTVLFRPYRMALWRVTHPFVWRNRMDHMWGVTTPEGSEKIGTPGWSFNKEHFPMHPKCTDNANSGRYNEFRGLHVIFSSRITGANISRRSWLVIFAGWIPCDVWPSAKKPVNLGLVTCDIRYGLKSTVCRLSSFLFYVWERVVH